MHANDLTGIPGAGRLGAAEAGGADSDRAKVRALAEQFESMLLAQMLREMKQAMSPETDDQGLGGPLIGDTIATELAIALGRTNSLGLADLVGTGLDRMGTGTGEGLSTPAASPTAPPDVSAAVALPTAAATPVPGASPRPPVTSQYGWRLDPLNGQHRFHAGLDLRAAYGQEVRTATEGVVTFSGEKPGYGLVVVVSHGSGLETRYAHLSSTGVAEGDRVQAGDVIARSGRSGRATGPHLHFEVRQHGQPVDPERVAGLVPAVGRRPGAAD